MAKYYGYCDGLEKSHKILEKMKNNNKHRIKVASFDNYQEAMQWLYDKIKRLEERIEKLEEL